MTEQQIEQELIKHLTDLKYIYRQDIHDRASLEANFREKFEALNRVRLTDGEFSRLLEQIVTPDVFSAARLLRERNSFERDDGTPLFYTLVNIKDWCKNTFEVVNQLRINTDYSHHRYDVILLINGVPVVQIELKTLAISPRRAMQQIVDYKNDPGNGYGKTLLCFLQLFIVSNMSDTWYFANNNNRHFSFDADERFLPLYQFAGDDNKKITQLDRFADRFLAKCTLAEMISRYMVLVASEQKLMVMRPYQIYAVQAIVDCIHQNCGNGYIWHTTGSGKTLTSFKASTLLKDNPDIEKCLFVVDRKDLDRQTREEFNRFQEGCVEANTNTAALVQRLLSDDYADKVIVTTIQKLGNRCVTSAWCSFLTSVTVLSLVITTKLSKTFSQMLNCSASLEHLFLKKTLPIRKSQGSKVTIKLQRIFFSVSYTPILSLMPLKIATCCVFLLNTTNQRTKAPPSSTSRCASVLLWKLYWINTMLQPHSASSMRCLPHRASFTR